MEEENSEVQEKKRCGEWRLEKWNRESVEGRRIVLNSRGVCVLCWGCVKGRGNNRMGGRRETGEGKH